jgi:peptidoglycan hydrolase-like protein with peptidoglycan-binding domain
MLACAGTALALLAAGGATRADAAGTTVAARADWSAGPVAYGAGYALERGSLRVREVQRRLDRLGYAPGPVDGRFGPRTQRAAVRFQRRSGLRTDAVVGPRTLSALRTRDDARLARQAERRAPNRRVGTPAHPPAPAPPRSIAGVPAAGTVGTDVMALIAAAFGLLVALVLHRRTRPQQERVAREIVAAAPDHAVGRSPAADAPRFTRPQHVTDLSVRPREDVG